MRLFTLPRLWLLDPKAMEEVFHAPPRLTLLVGAILVLSAGVARNYDGVDLLAEPWWLAGPFVASVLTSAMLWVMACGWLRVKVQGPLWRPYARFLAVYWATAPLAWLYGIPYESLLRPVQALEANALTLLVVAGWRVLIISRLLSVLTGVAWWRTGVYCLFYGSLVMFITSMASSKAVIDVMGGLRLSEEERAASNLSMATSFYSLLSTVAFCIGALLVRPAGDRPLSPAPATAKSRDGTVLAAAAACLALWCATLPFTQPQQARARAVEAAAAAGDYTTVAKLLNAHERGAFPAAWSPPGTRGALQVRAGALLGVLPALGDTPRPWLRDSYIRSARRSIGSDRKRPTESVDVYQELASDDELGHDLTRGDAGYKLVLLEWLVANDPQMTDDQRKLFTHWLAAPQASPPAPSGPAR